MRCYITVISIAYSGSYIMPTTFISILYSGLCAFVAKEVWYVVNGSCVSCVENEVSCVMHHVTCAIEGLEGSLLCESVLFIIWYFSDFYVNTA